MNENPLWSQRYRPRTISDCILPPVLKTTFQEFVDKKSIPNLLLSGRSGVGKTTVARALCEELDADYVVFNGSLNLDKDTLRNEIKVFASAMSLMGRNRKYIIIDEADYLSANHVQPALRNFMEEYSNNVGFVLTCNFKNKIIPPLHSRCAVIEFVIPRIQRPHLAKEYLERLTNILDREKIEYDAPAVVGVVKHFFPDLRRTLNELQRYSVTGKIDSGILCTFAETSVEELIKHLKKNDFVAVRKWVGENQDIDAVELFRVLYDIASQHVQPKFIPDLVILLAKYQYQHSFVADQTINTTACLVEVMSEIQFK